MVVVKRLEVSRLYKGFAMIVKGIYTVLLLFGLCVLLAALFCQLFAVTIATTTSGMATTVSSIATRIKLQ
jgi:hypothetical protein